MRKAENSGAGGIVALVLLYLALALAFVFSVPLWEAPDEPAHFLRIRAEARRLGLLNGSDRNCWLFPPEGEPPPLDHPGLALQRRPGFWKKGTVVSGYERHQPPGYYLLAAPILALAGGGAEPPFFFNSQYESRQGQVFLHGADRDPPFATARRAVLLLRLLSTLFGAVTVVLIWCTAGYLVSGASREPLALAAAALTAFLPQFIFVTSVINNDALALALSALFFHVLLRPSGTRRRLTPLRITLLALIFAAALLTELALVFLLPAALAWFAAAGTGRRRLRTAAAAAFAVLLPTLLLLVGPGGHIADSAYWDPLRQLERMSSVGHGLLQWESLRETVRLFFISAWGVFGWMSVVPPLLLTAACIAVSVIIILGLLRLLGTGSRGGPGPEPAPGVRLLFAAALISLAFLVVRNALFTFQPQGRMFFPLLPLAAPLAAAGLQRIGPRIPGRLTLPVVLFMLGASLYGVLGMIRPYYVPQRAPIRFTLPAESAILYGLYGAGFSVQEPAGQSTVAGLEQTGALRLHNAAQRQVRVLLRFTVRSEEPGQALEVWDRRGLAGRFDLEMAGRRFFQLGPLTLPPGETVLFFHLTGEPGGNGCAVSGLTIAAPPDDSGGPTRAVKGPH
jgi:hypothetical protein